MKKAIRKVICCAWCVLFCLLCAGCGSGDGSGERTAMEFTVVEGDEVPTELRDIIEAHKTQEIKMTYEGGDGLYIVRGYGEQPTGGYSISADLVELGEDGIHVTTTLIGPSSAENPAQEPSYPWIVLKVENTGQEVIFE